MTEENKETDENDQKKNIITAQTYREDESFEILLGTMIAPFNIYSCISSYTERPSQKSEKGRI